MAEPENKELTDDNMSIVHVYSYRQNGKRRNKNNDDKNISKPETTNNIERLVGNQECTNSDEE